MAPKLNPKFQNWLAQHTKWIDPATVDEEQNEELLSIVEGSKSIFDDVDPSDEIAVLDFDISEQEFIEDIEDRLDDIRDLKVDTRQAWRRYQRRLEDAKERDGIDEFNAKAEAKDAKGAAQSKQERFEKLWAEVIRMRQLWRKHQQLKVNKQTESKRRFTFEEAKVGNVAKAMDELSEMREREEEHRQDIGYEIDQAGVTTEVDFEDIEKSVAELEMAEMGLDEFVYEDDGTDETDEDDGPEPDVSRQ